MIIIIYNDLIVICFGHRDLKMGQLFHFIEAIITSKQHNLCNESVKL